jgi:hypothetical protein
VEHTKHSGVQLDVSAGISESTDSDGDVIKGIFAQLFRSKWGGVEMEVEPG